MKSQSILSLRGITKIIFLATLLIITSCSNQKKDAKEEEGQSAVSKTDVKPPQIDIHTAVVSGNLDALKQHIAAGTDLNEKDPFGGSSPLISATVFGKTEEARLLIEAGVDLNFQNNDGSTALHTAAFFCRPEIVKMLLDKGVDKTIKNKYGETAYQSVAGPFSEVKSSYDMMGKMLGPMGLKLDYPYVEKTRPEIAAMLK
jgi:ankyrin repeat protein